MKPPLTSAAVLVLSGALIGAAILVPLPGPKFPRERVDVLAPGPFVVERTQRGQSEFLVYTETDGGEVAPEPDWSPLWEQAWLFPALEDAQEAARRTGGIPLALRRVTG